MKFFIEFPVTIETLEEGRMRATFHTPDDRTIEIEGKNLEDLQSLVAKRGGFLHTQSAYGSVLKREDPAYMYTFNAIP